jgi:hypothetical protein
MLIVPDSNSQPWTPGNLLEAFPPPKPKGKKKPKAPPPELPEPEAAAEDAPEARRPVAPPPRQQAAAPPPTAVAPPRQLAAAPPAKRPAPPPPRVQPPARDPVDYEPAPGEGDDDTEVEDDDIAEPITDEPPAKPKPRYVMKKKRRPQPVVAESRRGPEIHSAKAHRCVDKVTAKGGAVEPWAVCTSSIGKAGVYTKGHGGSASPKRTREADAAMDALVEAMVQELRG